MGIIVYTRGRGFEHAKGWMVEVRRILREGNRCADHIANLPHEGMDGLVRLHSSPNSLLPLLHVDAHEHGRARF
ncbi:hypothetical protein PVK06_003246 [Gossypium arboreum]|uniref:Uncharacterized protein n=1 Tax=Gossypium arboreum TaxID=29729 RepID=A0ABR0R5S3_GOSAR|nr:hypothetical protein PVK06_003246 [Gossypium arboreum]